MAQKDKEHGLKPVSGKGKKMVEIGDYVVYVNKDASGKEMVRSDAEVLDIVENEQGKHYLLDLDKENKPSLIHEDNIEVRN